MPQNGAGFNRTLERFAVEASQHFDTAALDALRRTTIGDLVLGSGFDPREFPACAAGVALGLLIERVLPYRNAAGPLSE